MSSFPLISGKTLFRNPCNNGNKMDLVLRYFCYIRMNKKVKAPWVTEPKGSPILNTEKKGSHRLP